MSTAPLLTQEQGPRVVALAQAPNANGRQPHSGGCLVTPPAYARPAAHPPLCRPRAHAPSPARPLNTGPPRIHPSPPCAGNYDLLALRNGYHGLSGDTMGLCGQHTWKQPVPQGFGVRHVLNPDPYRGPFGNDGKR